jgi:signal peptidase II
MTTKGIADRRSERDPGRDREAVGGKSLAKDQIKPGDGLGKYVLVASIAGVIVLLDQWTKLWVDADMRLYQSIPVIDGFFSLTYVRNKGAAFSMFADFPDSFRTPFFMVVTVVAVVGIGWFVRSTPREDKLSLISLAFILGGALGNAIDRLAYGSVVDFLDVYVNNWHWPAFNVADAFITTGVILLLIAGFVGGGAPQSEEAKT